ncbi:MAG: TFIIB-type zinc ribbon-containing protein [Clostridia bacterium]|nr:TFIIB-type zinc ribbon-containing protein [Clostridia bacterium]
MNEVKGETLSNEEIALAKKSDTTVSKCPSCGANLTYNPAHATLECAYCGTEVKVDMSDHAEEIEFARIVAGNNAWGEETKVFQCSNCGARQILEKRAISPTCAFCGTSNVVETDAISGLKPNAILPFLLTKDSASKFYVKWAKKKIFAPSAFKKDLKSPEKLSGHYYPAFTFDSNTHTTYSGVLGKHYYTTYRDSKGNVHTKRHTRYFNISGRHAFFFNDVFVQASAPTDTKMLKKLSPYNTDGSHKYSPDFLHGYSASVYEKDGLKCWGEARNIMQEQVKKQILRGYDYDVVQSFNANMQCSNTTYKYVMIPVYVGHTNFRKKLYNFFMNGQSGKVWGKTPKSPLRIALAVLLGAAIIAGAVVATTLLLL